MCDKCCLVVVIIVVVDFVVIVVDFVVIVVVKKIKHGQLEVMYIHIIYTPNDLYQQICDKCCLVIFVVAFVVVKMPNMVN